MMSLISKIEIFSKICEDCLQMVKNWHSKNFYFYFIWLQHIKILRTNLIKDKTFFIDFYYYYEKRIYNHIIWNSKSLFQKIILFFAHTSWTSLCGAFLTKFGFIYLKNLFIRNKIISYLPEKCIKSLREKLGRELLSFHKCRKLSKSYLASFNEFLFQFCMIEVKYNIEE